MIRAILDELKQRSVVRVAGLYAVTGWAVFQVINTLVPALEFPRWIVTMMALIFLAGFPVAVALAWMFEITPEGVKLVPSDRRKFGAGQFGWIDWMIAALVAAVFAFAAVQLVNLRNNADGFSFGGAHSRSVAVLPFASFSEVQGDGYFADGLTEEIINSLAQAPELKVAGRTSSFYFKGKNEDLREVGRSLGVAHVVEGSVRRAGERLRVTAQLIDVEDGFHLWSETYDRTVDDALAIQTEVAEAVAERLKTELVGLPEPEEANPDDYRLLLIAEAQLRTQNLPDLRAARQAFSEIRQRDPGNATAHAGFAQATIILAQNFMAFPFDSARKEAAAAIERALEADPQSADAWRARGAYERVMAIRSGDGSHHVLSLKAFRKALEYDPRDPETMILLAKQLLGEGRSDQAIGLLRAALATDPLSRTGQEVMADALSSIGRYDEARRSFETLLSLYPDFTAGISAFAEMLLFKQGKLDEAAQLLSDPRHTAEDPLNALLLSSSLANMGDLAAAQSALDLIGQNSEARPIANAAKLQLQGKRSELLTYAMEVGEGGDPVWESVKVVESSLMGEHHAARAALAGSFSGLLESPPEVAGYREVDVIIAGAVLQRSGDEERGRVIIEKVIQRLDGASFRGPDQIAVKGLALAALGRTEESVATYDAAAKAGWRHLIDFDYFVPVYDYPFMAEVARTARFKAVVARVQADNRRMLENYRKARTAAWAKQAAPPRKAAAP